MEKKIKEAALSLFRKLPHKVEMDDLLQEGRIAVWLKRAKIADLNEEHANAFAYQCAKWAMIDWIRYMWPARGKNGAILNINVDDYEEWVDVAGSDTTISHAKAMQAIEKIEGMIKSRSNSRTNKLVADYRLKILHGFIDGTEGKTIAMQLGIRPETVTIHRGEIRKFLAEIIS